MRYNPLYFIDQPSNLDCVLMSLMHLSRLIKFPIMKNLSTIALAFGLLFFCSCSSEQKRTTSSEIKNNDRPNVIFIMADDHAQKAISAYDNTLIETPHIDRLYEEGMLLENSFVTNSICAPSRATMLTGKFSHLNGKKDNMDTFDISQMIFPKLLRKNGYQTAMIGKWHLKSRPQGFDYWDILIGQGDYYQPEFVSNEDTTIVEGYTTDIITDKVLDYLENRDQEKPFCVFYHHKAPHRNWMPNIKDLALYSTTDFELPETFSDDYEGRPAAREADMRIEDMFLSFDMKLHESSYEVETGTGGNQEFDPEEYWRMAYQRLTQEQRQLWDAHYDTINENFRNGSLSGRALTAWKFQQYLKDYLRCIKSIDDNVGRLLQYLDGQGLTENTIVIYTSDQGFYLGEHGWYDKRFMYEQSLRTPFLIRYPKEIKGRTRSAHLIQNIDYAPTLLDYAQVPIPADMQGISLRGILSGKEPEEWRSSIYYHYYEYPHGWHHVAKHEGVRTDRYKLIHFYGDTEYWELYDLQLDSSEKNNLYNQPLYREVQDNLLEELAVLKERYKVTIP